MKYLLLALLVLTGCEDKPRPEFTVECYDKMDKIMYKGRHHSFTVEAAMPGKYTAHTCIITGDEEQ